MNILYSVDILKEFNLHHRQRTKVLIDII